MSNNGQKNRPAPAFQEYASDMLANSRYRTMSLAERGLLDTMRRECWVNGSVPKEPEELSALLGKSIAEIMPNLSIKVLSFFAERNDQLICPELDAYRINLEIRSKKMSEGGKKGGKNTQRHQREAKATLEATIKPLSRNEISRDKLNRDEIKSLGERITTEEFNDFVAEYDSSPEASNSYFIVSKGGY